jgi:electron transfer flavoprotein alpha subunit
VVAEHDKKVLTPGTLSAITAATQVSNDVTLLVMGKGVSDVAAQAAQANGVCKVAVLESDALSHLLAEDTAEAVKQAATSYTHIIAPSSNSTKNYLPRAAALANCSPLTDVTAVINADTFQRPIYAGNAVATVQMTAAQKFILIRPTAFEKTTLLNKATAPIETLSVVLNKSPLSSFVSASAIQSDRVDLGSARVVVSGGRGMKSGENFSMLDSLATKLGGAVGASRAAVDAGFVPNEYQVGQTGKVVAPDLYIAVGISGAIQHLSGMKDSKTIVAINKDKDAPIFQVADYGLVDDLFKAVPELLTKL